MLSLDAKEWKDFDGGYKLPYDASLALKLLEISQEPDSKIWNTLFENLYHQGDVGIASYAVIPQLLRIYKTHGWIDFYLPSLASAIEEARTRENNPEVPDWLSYDYFQALEGIAVYCLQKRSEQSDPNFGKALLMLTAILLKAKDTYELLDSVQIGDEEKILKLYDRYA
jgi:hypothetical protein